MINKILDRLKEVECGAVGQTVDEIKFNLNVVKLLQPKLIVEIGSAEGGNIVLMSSVLNQSENYIIISIDPWSENTKYYNVYESYCNTITLLNKKYSHIEYHQIRQKSQSKNAKGMLEKYLSEFSCKIDFLFIDGDHNYESVFSDWQCYSEYMSPQGIICFHDIKGYSGVEILWKQIVKSNIKNIVEYIVPGSPLIKGYDEIDYYGLGYYYFSTDYLIKEE